MAYWIASGNRQNWEVVKKYNIWGVPKRSKGLHSRVKARGYYSHICPVRNESKRSPPIGYHGGIQGNRTV